MTAMNSRFGFSREIESEISKRRSYNLRLRQKRIESLREKYPDVYALDMEEKEISLDIASKIIESPKDAPALEALGRKLIAEKRGELRSALERNGLPQDYLEPQYICRICGDTGFADGELCGCMKKIIVESTFKGSGIDRDQCFAAYRRDLFTDPKLIKASETIRAYCMDYAARFPDNELPDLLLMGAPGVGKTFLLNCIGGEVLKKGASVIRITANRMISDVMESIRDYDFEKPDLTLPDLLIIDDLGTEPMINNITVETILSVICERQDSGKATLIATNKDIESLQEEYGQRIFSRLVSPNRVKIFHLMNPSIRTMNLRRTEI